MQIRQLAHRTQEHIRNLANAMDYMTKVIALYAKSVIHLAYLHAQRGVWRMSNVARHMYTPILKHIGLARRRPPGRGQPDYHVMLSC